MKHLPSLEVFQLGARVCVGVGVCGCVCVGVGVGVGVFVGKRERVKFSII